MLFCEIVLSMWSITSIIIGVVVVINRNQFQLKSWKTVKIYFSCFFFSSSIRSSLPVLLQSNWLSFVDPRFLFFHHRVKRVNSVNSFFHSSFLPTQCLKEPNDKHPSHISGNKYSIILSSTKQQQKSSEIMIGIFTLLSGSRFMLSLWF